MKSFLLLPLIDAITAAAPAPKPDNFEADPLLDIGSAEESSYATKRDTFWSDPQFHVGNAEESSYAARSGKFESDPLLQVGSKKQSLLMPRKGIILSQTGCTRLGLALNLPTLSKQVGVSRNGFQRAKGFLLACVLQISP
ncbi:hypothetical protein DL764_004077 [Monosporascus ibericus]|uniref:Uncharacterized protein n=1 Tax=Monosporascus ibericus TaxID=155417 RepID=A0A4Q4TET7_9PEZI|nr:hypothetical protein DL764_004077 [Monosporascus ibericus]